MGAQSTHMAVREASVSRLQLFMGGEITAYCTPRTHVASYVTGNKEGGVAERVGFGPFQDQQSPQLTESRVPPMPCLPGLPRRLARVARWTDVIEHGELTPYSNRQTRRGSVLPLSEFLGDLAESCIAFRVAVLALNVRRELVGHGQTLQSHSFELGVFSVLHRNKVVPLEFIRTAILDKSHDDICDFVCCQHVRSRSPNA